MRLLPASTPPSRRVQYGNQLAKNLWSEGLIALGDEVKAATSMLKELSRALEDAAEPIYQAQARQVRTRTQLLSSAHSVRLGLSSRGAEATKASPYVDIFPEPLESFPDAPPEAVAEAFAQLNSRLEHNLGTDDFLIQTYLPRLKGDLEAYREAFAELLASLEAEAECASQVNEATLAFNALVQRVHGNLSGAFGRKQAERFFPVVRTKKLEASPEEVPIPDPAASEKL